MPKQPVYKKAHIEAFLAANDTERKQSRFRKFKNMKVAQDEHGKNVLVEPPKAEHKQPRIVVAIEDVPELLKQIYFNPASGYLSANKLYSAAHAIYAGIPRRVVREFISKVSSFQETRPSKPIRTIKPIAAKRPYSHWQVDLIDLSMYKGSNNGYTFALTCIDLFTKKAHAKKLLTKSAQRVRDAMQLILNQNPKKPSIIQSDNGSEFISSEFKALLDENSIKHVTSSSYTPSSNGAIERFNKTLKTMMFRYFTANSTKRWIDIIESLVESYNSSKHDVTKKIPNELDMARLDHEDVDHAKDNIQQKAEKSITRMNYGQLSVGDYCRVSLQTFVEIRKQQFRKGFERNWSRELYIVTKRIERKAKGKQIDQVEAVDKDNLVERTDYYKLKRADNDESMPGYYHISRLLAARSDQIEEPKKKQRSEPKEVKVYEEGDIAKRIKERKRGVLPDGSLAEH